MACLVADSSGLISLGTAADTDPDPLTIAVARYDVLVPTVVVEELRETSSYDDVHGQAATAVLAAADSFETRSVELDDEFPLDDGENAAVALANDTEAALLLCDEFNQLGLVHASLVDTRLVTTPTLLAALVRTGELSADDARSCLDDISAARSWNANSYVQRARSLLRD
jgi:predicted nucleic acid-binding protein